jgi:hypothetical protein
MPCKLRESDFNEFTGKTGEQTTLRVSGQAGAARLTGARYADQDVTVDGDSVTFTIVSGSQARDLVIEDSIPDDTVELRETTGGDCDQLLDSFRYDPLNPTRGYTIIGE